MTKSIPFWLDDSYTPLPSLHSNTVADIVIIGGGVTGLSTACFLSENGCSSVVLERDTISSGASGRNAGFLIAGSVEYYHRVVHFLGREPARRLWNLSTGSHTIVRDWIERYHLNCAHYDTGSLVLAETPQELSEISTAAKLLNEDGFQAEVLTQAVLKQEWGEHLARFYGGYYCDSDGVINPARLLRGFARALQSETLNIYEKTEVLDIRETGEHISVHTPGGSVEGQFVLVAANAYIPQLIHALDGKITPVKGQMFATEPLPYINPVPCYANFGYDYFRQLDDGRFIIGGSRDHHETSETGNLETPTDNIQRELEQYFLDLMGFADLPAITHRWGGIMGFARDGLPVAGKLPWSNRIFVAGGFTGHGMSLAPKVGEILADVLIEGHHPDFSLFSIRRFL